ncbi:MAG: hypothetical protein P4L41_18885 [Flavipsychrobacter sp.]|nr:hypothetical protein [Flavipsychrobacter sp.]
MKIKGLILFVFLVAAQQVFSYDKIYTVTGGVIKSKIESVNDSIITYKKSNYLDGPDYYIEKKSVKKVIYDATARVVYDTIVKKVTAYRSNVLAIAPIQYSDNGHGIGGSYEHFLKVTKCLSLFLPVYQTHNSFSGGYSTSIFYYAPGIKFYPVGNQGILRVAIGLSYIGASGRLVSQDYPTGHDFVMSGVIITGSINVNITKFLYLGVDFGEGSVHVVPFVSNHVTGEFAVRVGGRF